MPQGAGASVSAVAAGQHQAEEGQQTAAAGRELVLPIRRPVAEERPQVIHL